MSCEEGDICHMRRRLLRWTACCSDRSRGFRSARNIVDCGGPGKTKPYRSRVLGVFTVDATVHCG